MCVCVSACLSVGGQAGRPEVSEAREVQWGWAKAMDRALSLTLVTWSLPSEAHALMRKME